ncbi:hypothetical protein PRVXH_000704 [Proteinivorax hydrogeniformans]|uniref:DUF4306 domain-containing protein n=1 Tax=Proteinivorax hydrogeniformans TaxID=1826727 RepID=A0AAU8HVI4_9FIRM
MNTLTNLPKKHLYYILISCSIIIVATSMETLMTVKDIDLFNQWLENHKAAEGAEISVDEAFNVFISVNLIYFLFKLVIPISISLHSYFAYIKLKINGLFVFIWTVLVLGSMAYTLFEWSINSIFYYINLTGYFILVVTLLSLINVIDKSKTS